MFYDQKARDRESRNEVGHFYVKSLKFSGIAAALIGGAIVACILSAIGLFSMIFLCVECVLLSWLSLRFWRYKCLKRCREVCKGIFS